MHKVRFISDRTLLKVYLFLDLLKNFVKLTSCLHFVRSYHLISNSFLVNVPVIFHHTTVILQDFASFFSNRFIPAKRRRILILMKNLHHQIHHSLTLPSHEGFNSPFPPNTTAPDLPSPAHKCYSPLCSAGGSRLGLCGDGPGSSLPVDLLISQFPRHHPDPV